MATIAEALDIAIKHHGAGRLSEAEEIYRRILEVDPNQPDAVHLLGAIAYQVGHNGPAIELIARAVALKPDFPLAHDNLGMALQRAGRLDEALIHFRRATTLKPDFAEAHDNLGDCLQDLGQFEAAVTAHTAAVALRPESPDFHWNLGNALRRSGRLDEAIAAYRTALALHPDYAEAHSSLGNAYLAQGRGEEALACCRTAVALKPDFAGAHTNLAGALKVMGLANGDPDLLEAAAASFRRAIALNPHQPDAHNNLGNTLQELGRLDQAIASYTEAIALKPDFAKAHANLGHLLKKMGVASGDRARLDEAIACYSKALSIDPHHADAHNGLGAALAAGNRIPAALRHFDAAVSLQPDLAEAHLNRALALFVAGRLGEAWADYEWRWKGQGRLIPRPFPQPWWNGRRLDDATLLIWGEQGLGDQLIGAGMIPDAMRLARHCVVECEPRLVDLFARSFPAATVVPRRAPPEAAALAADRQIPLLGLARYCRAEPGDFPRHSGYLVADPAKVQRWRRWLATLGPGPKIGLSWKSQGNDWRSANVAAPLDRIPILLAVPGLAFVSLQYGEFAEDIAVLERASGVRIHCPPDIDMTNDIDGVAALVTGLDAVVGLATAAVVIAGALGRPGWMYAYYPAFCEMAVCDRDHMPWCPSIRVETCGVGEDWTGPITRIADALKRFTR